MEKIKKVQNLIIILSILFLSIDAAYPFESGFCLRKPLDFNSSGAPKEQNRYRAALEATANWGEDTTRRKFLVAMSSALIGLCFLDIEGSDGNQGFVENSLKLFAQIKDRNPGSQNHTLAAEFIKAALAQMGYSGKKTKRALVSRNIQGIGTTYIAAYLRLENKNNPKNLVLCAHFDSIRQGADDNASGVVALLELARVLSSYNPYSHNIYFVFTGDEEYNHLGVRTFLKDAVLRNVNPENTTVINIDTIGQSHLTATNIKAEEKRPQIWITPASSKAVAADNWWEELAKSFHADSPLDFHVDKEGEIIAPGEEAGTSDAALFALYGFKALTISGVSQDLARRVGIINDAGDNIRNLDFGSINKIITWIGNSVEKIDDKDRHVLLSTARNLRAPKLAISTIRVTQDFNSKTIGLFSEYKLQFTPSGIVLPEEVYRFFVSYLDYLTTRWPAYNKYFKGIDNSQPAANVAYAGDNGIIKYGFNLALQAVRDPYTHDPIFGVRYSPREVVITHETGHFAHNSENITSRDLPEKTGLGYDQNSNEILATDFSLMFLYNMVTLGRFIGTYLHSKDRGHTIYIARKAVDLKPSESGRRSFNEELFEKVGVRPFVKPFSYPGRDIKEYLPKRALLISL